MSTLMNLVYYDIKRRAKDGFFIGYNIVFPIIMILLLGYLTSKGYGKEFTSYQYYGVVMLPFCIAMAIITAAYAAKDDAYKKTAVRFLFSPVSNCQIVLSKLLCCMLIMSFCNLIVLLFDMIVLHLPLSKSFLPVFLLLSAQTFCIIAVGLFIGFGMKNFIFIKKILNLPIFLAAFLAGAFYPIGTLNPRLDLLIKLSPLTWVNRSIFLAIYDDSTTTLWNTTAQMLVVGVIFTGLAISLFKKEEYIHGDLPGYEK